MSVNISDLDVCGHFLYQKSLKIFRNKFGGKEKMSTFAIPNEKRGNKNLEFGKRSSLKRLITVQEASTEKIQFIEKR